MSKENGWIDRVNISKDLIERARNPASCDIDIGLLDDLADRIEELESRLEKALAILSADTQIDAEANFVALRQERDQLRDQVKVLHKVMNRIAFSRVGKCENIALELFNREAWAKEALAATEPK